MEMCATPLILVHCWMRWSRKLHENAFYFMHVFHFTDLTFILALHCISFSHSNDLLYALKTAIDLHDANMQTHTLSLFLARTINNLNFKLEGPVWLPHKTNCCINDIFIRHIVCIFNPIPPASLMTAIHFADTFNIRRPHFALGAQVLH